MIRGTTVAALTAAVLLGSVLAGCSQDSPAPEPGPTAPSAAVTDRTPEPLPALKAAKGAMKDVTLDRCDVTAGAVAASGKLANSTKKKTDFAVTIYWMPANSSDPIASASTTLAGVGSRDDATWSVEASLPTDAARCVVNARRGTLD